MITKRTANQCRHLLKDEMMCWTFLKDPDIPLTNNRAENAIRPYVIWCKLSFATQYYQGDQYWDGSKIRDEYHAIIPKSLY